MTSRADVQLLLQEGLSMSERRLAQTPHCRPTLVCAEASMRAMTDSRPQMLLPAIRHVHKEQINGLLAAFLAREIAPSSQWIAWQSQ